MFLPYQKFPRRKMFILIRNSHAPWQSPLIYVIAIHFARHCEAHKKMFLPYQKLPHRKMFILTRNSHAPWQSPLIDVIARHFTRHCEAITKNAAP
jgi:hypothetical protein